jgi:membrane protein implicated in regulation of membrane protease activity
LLDFFLLPENLPFSVALLVMLMIGAAEAIGLGAGAVHLDAHGDVHAEGGDLLGWLGIGVVPLLIVLVVLLAWFALIGIGLQQLASSFWGGPLSPWLAAPAALAGALPLTGAGARVLARILPGDETTAVGPEALLGRRAEIVVGEARRGSPARGRVRDVHGQTHYVMVEPTEEDGRLGTGETALLVRRDGQLFFGLPDLHPLHAAD